MKLVKTRNPKRANSTPVPVGKGAKVMAARKKTRNRGASHRNAPRRRNPVARRNPHRHHRRRRNPGETMDIITLSVWGALGAIAAGLIAPLIPWGQDNALTRGGVKIGLGLLAMYAFKGKGEMGKGLALGAGIAGVSEAIRPYLPQSLSGAPAQSSVIAVPINPAQLTPAAATQVAQQMSRNRNMGRLVSFPTNGIPGLSGIRRVR